MASLLVIFTFFLVLFIFFSYFFFKKMKISTLKKMPTALVVGFPNSGRSFIIKELCKANTGIYDKILNVNYVDFVQEGTPPLKLLDHQIRPSNDGKLDHNSFRDLRYVNPQSIIGIVDVSRFSESIDEQIEFIANIKKKFDGKKLFLVANKVEKNSEDKLKRLRVLEEKIYKVRMNKLEDVEKLRNDITRSLRKT